jgi:hypothetical protein
MNRTILNYRALLPCPTKPTDHQYNHHPSIWEHEGRYVIYCASCIRRTAPHDTFAEAKKEWNHGQTDAKPCWRLLQQNGNNWPIQNGNNWPIQIATTDNSEEAEAWLLDPLIQRPEFWVESDGNDMYSTTDAKFLFGDTI